jgi:hypothetical protein
LNHSSESQLPAIPSGQIHGGRRKRGFVFEGPFDTKQLTTADHSIQYLSASADMRQADAIATKINALDTSRQAEASFYRRLSRPQRIQLEPTMDYDRFLMLHKPPPPWKNLESFGDTMVDGQLQPGRNPQLNDMPMIVNRRSAKAFLGSIEVWQKRRKPPVPPLSKEVIDVPSVSESTTNIFQSSNSQNKKQKLTSQQTDTINGQGISKSGIRDLAKPIRPISSLPKPPRPNDTKTDNSSHQKQSISIKQHKAASKDPNRSAEKVFGSHLTPSSKGSLGRTKAFDWKGWARSSTA